MALLSHVTTEMKLDVEFNCVLCGHLTRSRAMESLVQGLTLYDAWDQTSSIQTFTHFIPSGAARLYIFYMTEGLRTNKQGMETIAAAFTEQLHFLSHAEVMEGGA